MYFDLAAAFSPLLLKHTEPPWTPDSRGNPHPPQSVIGALVLKIYKSASYDEIEARLKGMKELFCKTFDVDRIPTHSVIHRAMKKTTTKYLRNLLEKTIQKVGEDRRTAIDSSGFVTKESSEWYDIRIGEENQKRMLETTLARTLIPGSYWMLG